MNCRLHWQQQYSATLLHSIVKHSRQLQLTSKSYSTHVAAILQPLECLSHIC
jgi:hypothetical protein